ncbi:hypothetical protein GCM10022415_08330 [Knoellia locipacati]|uniref:DAPG hydrolase PhiG domain-containing protein n=2 Tax=Knoellia locipacati TaxID=882824 RepID=A0A512SXZ7_9MICO|nr:hypothetical protein KLO01_08310 [Knoellia locipacati]
MPAPRSRLYPLRELTSAVTSVQDLPHHRRRLTIDHQPLAGVTPAMLHWWFRHLGGEMDYGGHRVPKYLVWHPEDHIRWELARPAPGGGAGEGARFRIVEAFQRRPEFYVDSTETVEKLDETGIRLVRRLAGVPIFQLEHTWSRGASGTHYVSVMDLGARGRAFMPVNRFLTQRTFPDAMARAWLRHNVEEVGLLEHLLPPLLAQQD